ncbi:hypothetical protein ACIPW5_04220 [Streptomyces sp. NPDC090077]|uniref:hypothetical protein n=1 Tax=Streptomyces sp. NPDC090077 TaxID=3365938 RepID=UPI00380C6E4A
MRIGLLGGALGLGAMLLAAVPASAAPVSADSPGKVRLVADGATAQATAAAAGCRYGGYIIYSNGRVVHVIICDD